MLITQVANAMRDVINLSTPMLQAYINTYSRVSHFSVSKLTYNTYHCSISTNYIHRTQYILYQLKNVMETKRIVCGPYMALCSFE